MSPWRRLARSLDRFAQRVRMDLLAKHFLSYNSIGGDDAAAPDARRHPAPRKSLHGEEVLGSGLQATVPFQVAALPAPVAGCGAGASCARACATARPARPWPCASPA